MKVIFPSLIVILSLFIVPTTAFRYMMALKMSHVDDITSDLLLNRNNKITDFDKKVYEACSRVPKGNIKVLNFNI